MRQSSDEELQMQPSQVRLKLAAGIRLFGCSVDIAERQQYRTASPLLLPILEYR